MSAEEQPELKSPEEMDSASRRDFMKVAGISALDLVYSHPAVETLTGRGGRHGDYSAPGGDGGGNNVPHHGGQGGFWEWLKKLLLNLIGNYQH